jgi:hypothetical protein
VITLTKEEAQQVLNALEHAQATEPIWKTPIREAKETLRTRLAQPEPEPVECMCGICKLGKKDWVGLTDEEYEQLSHWAHVEIIERIEAKLREKNT